MNDKTMVRESARERKARDDHAPATNSIPTNEPGIRMLDPAVLGCLTIELVARLGRGAMTIQELASLDPGKVLVLDTPLNGSVDLTLNDRLVGRGEIVAVEDRFAVRVTEIFVHRP